MHVLITGATGFLGTALCSQLKEQGHELVELNSKNCDLTQQNSLLALNHLYYDQIFHLAAWTQAGDFCIYHPGEQWIINQQMNTNVLAWWKEHQPQAKLICIGTSCSYDPGQKLSEENYHTGTPIDSLFTYAMTKRMLYVGLLALHKQFDLRYLYLVPSTLYGPGYNAEKKKMHFIFDLIHKIIRGKLYGEPIILWGDGYQRRELVYVEDFVKIMLHLSNTCDNDIINIGAGEEFTIRHFTKLICEKVGCDFDSIQFDTSCYVGARSKCLVVNKLKKLFPEFNMTPLDVGFSKTIDWFWSERAKLVGNSK